MKIESLTNSKVKEWNKLKEKKYRDETNTFIVEGDHLIKEAKKNNLIVATVGLTEDFDYIVTKDILNKISSQQSGTSELAICKKLTPKDIKGNVIILDSIQDPGNLGTIIRSAVAFNIDTILLSNDCVDLYNDKVIRASEGMIFNVNIIRTELTTIINDLKEKGYTIYATTPNGSGAFENNEHVGIVIGNEGNGISQSILDICDKNITIPMNENCESLNAGVCASILMYELMVK